MAKQIVNDVQASELLLKMIKEEMAQTLLHGGRVEEEDEEANQVEIGSPSERGGSSAKTMLNLADALLNTMDSSHQSDEELRSALFSRLLKTRAHSKLEDQSSATALDSMESIENDSVGDGDDDSDEGMFWMHESTYNTDSSQDATRITAANSDTEDRDARSASLNEDELDVTERSPSNRTKNSTIQDLLSQFPEIVDASDEEKIEECNDSYNEDDFVDEYSCISDITGGFKSNVPPPPSNLRPSDDDRSRNKAVMIENLANVQKSPAGVADLHKRIRQPHWVRFDKVHIRYHKMIVCDNPGNTGGGPSLGLGWRYHPVSMEKSVDDYERERRRHRCRGSALAWNRHEREQIALHHLGCTRKEMVEMVRRINRIKIQRRQTVNNLGAEKMEAAVENVSRKFKHLFTIKRN